MTNDDCSMAAELLAVSATAYAAYASNRLLEKVPEATLKLGDDAFRHWKEHYSERIRELSAALAEGQSVLFSSRVTWSREAFVARGISDALLEDSLECLSDILKEELPAFCSESPVQFIADAIQVLKQSEADNAAKTSDDEIPQLGLQYLKLVLEGDVCKAVQFMIDARDQGTPLIEIYQALTIAQYEVGRMWHHAAINIAEEHLVTFTTERTMAVLAFQAEKKESNGLTVVSAAVANNAHDVGIRVVSDFFEFAGWRAICLGGDLPAKDISAAVQWMDASLVLLSASLSTQLVEIREAITAVRASDTDCKIMVGGSAFSDAPEMWQGMGADGYAADPTQAVELGHKLVTGNSD